MVIPPSPFFYDHFQDQSLETPQSTPPPVDNQPSMEDQGGIDAPQSHFDTPQRVAIYFSFRILISFILFFSLLSRNMVGTSALVFYVPFQDQFLETPLPSPQPDDVHFQDQSQPTPLPLDNQPSMEYQGGIDTPQTLTHTHIYIA